MLEIVVGGATFEARLEEGAAPGTVAAFRRLLPLHVVAGAMAILLGTVALVVRKGTILHRRSGRLFAAAMITWVQVESRSVASGASSCPATRFQTCLNTCPARMPPSALITKLSGL